MYDNTMLRMIKDLVVKAEIENRIGVVRGSDNTQKDLVLAFEGLKILLEEEVKTQ